jgi:hypothetical protein
MNSIEHSILVVLLRLCEEAPHKRHDLISLASKQHRSEVFSEYLVRLSSVIGDSDAFIQLCATIRQEIK